MSSLPVPVSPVISTVSVWPATRSTRAMNLCITGLARMNRVSSILREITPGAGEAGAGDVPFATLGLVAASGMTTAIKAAGRECPESSPRTALENSVQSSVGRTGGS